MTRKRIGHSTIGLIVALLGWPALASDTLPKDSEPTTFNRFIRPILSDRCFTCHGPDSIKRKAALRLDRHEGALEPLPKHPKLRAFVPGKPEESEAWRRITGTDADAIMPPVDSHLKLTDSEKTLVRRWIEQGAKWEEHWAFIKPERPAAPSVQNAGWAKNDVDRFILHRLEVEGIKPSPQADKATLIRRVSLDLTGLPPTPAEVDAFLTDSSPNAYEKVVDRLLASPHYGEQMAIPWLDYARYADSHGYQADPERHMWHWRDWVINAYNSNMPFDQFTIEQIAGDLLPNATADQKTATGFNRNHRINAEGGVIAEEWRIEGVVDRVETTAEVWLGLTMGCGRCHDHKYDPITQKDFYSFAGYFNSINEAGSGDTRNTDRGNNVPPLLKLPTSEQAAQLKELASWQNNGKAKLAELDKHFPEMFQRWLDHGGAGQDAAGVAFRMPLNGSTDGHLGDGSKVPTTTSPDVEPEYAKGQFGQAVKLEKTTSIDAGQAIKLDSAKPFSISCWILVKKDGSVLSMLEPKKQQGLSIAVRNDTLRVSLGGKKSAGAIEVPSLKPLATNKWDHVVVTYDGSTKADGLNLYINGANQKPKFPSGSVTGAIAPGGALVIGKNGKSNSFEGQLEDLVVYSRVIDQEEVKQMASRPAIETILKLDRERWSAAQKTRVEEYVRACSPEYSVVSNDLAVAKRKEAELTALIGDTMIMEDLATPRENFVLIRGQYDKHGEKVPTGLPAVFPPLPEGAPNNRLGLAKWLISPENPLTARVQVNRLWEKFFNNGIVKTSENLGSQCEAPSHPELLDWLATDLISKKWDLKSFQKMLVMSATYQQTSTVTPELLERDPENRLLARGSRVRLPAEVIRDQALAVSGLLVDKIGGPSVKPYAPANLWEGNRFGNLAKYVQDKGEGLYRRSLYIFWKRTANPPNMAAFDMPSREYCVLKRSRSNTPLQALDLMNDPQYLEASRVLAEHMIHNGGSTSEDRIAYGFRRATGRFPTADESRILLAGYHKQLDRYRQDTASAEKFVAVGDTPRDAKLDVAELAAFTMTSSIMLNLDEVVNKP